MLFRRSNTEARSRNACADAQGRRQPWEGLKSAIPIAILGLGGVLTLAWLGFLSYEACEVVVRFI